MGNGINNQSLTLLQNSILALTLFQYQYARRYLVYEVHTTTSKLPMFTKKPKFAMQLVAILRTINPTDVWNRKLSQVSNRQVCLVLKFLF